MNSLFAHWNTENNESGYATNEDFRKLFTGDVNNLYLLSFLLTANHKMAERCFVAGLDECENESVVFKKWASSWARHVIVRNAIRIMTPRSGASGAAQNELHQEVRRILPKLPLEYVQYANILALEDFERLVFVLSVFEEYPEQKCAVLLSASCQEIRDARTSAMQHIADFAQATPAPANDSSKQEIVGR